MPGGKFYARDSRGADVSVETGTGVPAVVALTGSDVNYKITFAVPGLKFPVYGFLSSTGNEQLLTELRAAERSRTETHYRIETRRHANVDASLPWTELDLRTQTRRLLAQAGGVWSKEVAGNLADDTNPTPVTSPEPATASAPAPARAPNALSRIRHAAATAPELAQLLVAVGVVTTKIPIPDLLALLSTPPLVVAVQPSPAPVVNSFVPTRETDPTAAGRVLYDPGTDDVDDADELRSRPAAAPVAAPDITVLSKLVKLMRLSSVDPGQVASFIRTTFSVPSVQHMTTGQLAGLLDTYRVLGPHAGPAAFRDAVLSVAV